SMRRHCLSRGAKSVHSGTQVRRARAGRSAVHPRAAFRFATLARGYQYPAPNGAPARHCEGEARSNDEATI
ncbi:MAG: hypothetical protein LBF81_05680, partial [Prevotellaceae bacterium]|nr:hypothetical protein [Prevotellaceae bacterium]